VTNLAMGLVLGSPVLPGGGGWTPAQLFSAGQAGAWYDPSDSSAVFQDAAGTTPAGDGDPVGRIEDKAGNGNHATQSTSAARPTLRKTAGGLWYLEFDGADDILDCGSDLSLNTQMFACMHLAQAAGDSNNAVVTNRTSGEGRSDRLTSTDLFTFHVSKNTVSASRSAADWEIYYWGATSTDLFARVNAASLATTSGSTYTSSPENYSIGGSINESYRRLDGSLSQVIILSEKLSNENELRLRAYLASASMGEVTL